MEGLLKGKGYIHFKNEVIFPNLFRYVAYQFLLQILKLRFNLFWDFKIVGQVSLWHDEEMVLADCPFGKCQVKVVCLLEDQVSVDLVFEAEPARLIYFWCSLLKLDCEIPTLERQLTSFIRLAHSCHRTSNGRKVNEQIWLLSSLLVKWLVNL